MCVCVLCTQRTRLKSTSNQVSPPIRLILPTQCSTQRLHTYLESHVARVGCSAKSSSCNVSRLLVGQISTCIPPATTSSTCARVSHRACPRRSGLKSSIRWVSPSLSTCRQQQAYAQRRNRTSQCAWCKWGTVIILCRSFCVFVCSSSSSS